MRKSNLGGKDLFSLHFLSHSLFPEGKNRNPEAKTEAKAMEECCLLVCSSWLAQPAFLYHLDHPEVAQPPVRWTSHINHQSKKKKKECPTDLPTEPSANFFFPDASRFVSSWQNQPEHTTTITSGFKRKQYISKSKQYLSNMVIMCESIFWLLWNSYCYTSALYFFFSTASASLTVNQIVKKEIFMWLTSVISAQKADTGWWVWD